jgi:hypothetical protein
VAVKVSQPFAGALWIRLQTLLEVPQATLLLRSVAVSLGRSRFPLSDLEDQSDRVADFIHLQLRNH